MFYFDPIVHLAMENEIRRVMGVENKEDARQEAYMAIADECPLTVEDAVNCVQRAIQRYRKRISKISKMEQRDQDSWYGNSEPYYNEPETDEDGHTQAWWDYVAPITPVFTKDERRLINKALDKAAE